MTKQTDIAIIGGGIAGLALTALLGSAAARVSLVDPFPPPPLKDVKPSGRTVALMETSLNIVKAAGAWDKVKDRAGPLKAMRLVDDSAEGGETVEAEFSAAEIGQEQFGFNVPNDALRAALYETVRDIPEVTLHVPGKFAGYKIEGGHARIELENGTVINTSLLVGADGRNSPVREAAGIECRTRSYNQSAITCLISHSKSHGGAAVEFHRPAGPLALVPLPGNCSSVVWVETPDRAEQIMKLRKSDFVQALREATNDILGGLTLEAGPECWPLSSLKAREITAPRLALMAEAAHVMSPITAQGLNLSLRDVAALAETVADAMRAGLDPGSKTVLALYRKRRTVDINTRVFGVDGINRVVSNESGLIGELRRHGLKTVEGFEPLRKLAMQATLAPQIDSGRLARGEAL